MEFSYTGQYRFSGDAKRDWAIEFLSSGTLRFSRLGKAGRDVDLFCLGGGGGGRAAQFGYGGGGGGGGKTKTVRGAKITRGAAIDISIGSGGLPTRLAGLLPSGKAAQAYAKPRGDSREDLAAVRAMAVPAAPAAVTRQALTHIPARALWQAPAVPTAPMAAALAA